MAMVTSTINTHTANHYQVRALRAPRAHNNIVCAMSHSGIVPSYMSWMLPGSGGDFRSSMLPTRSQPAGSPTNSSGRPSYMDSLCAILGTVIPCQLQAWGWKVQTDNSNPYKRVYTFDCEFSHQGKFSITVTADRITYLVLERSRRPMSVKHFTELMLLGSKAGLNHAVQYVPGHTDTESFMIDRIDVSRLPIVNM
jgi:hypothetical protein